MGDFKYEVGDYVEISHPDTPDASRKGERGVIKTILLYNDYPYSIEDGVFASHELTPLWTRCKKVRIQIV